MIKVLTTGICLLVFDRRFSGSKLKNEVGGSCFFRFDAFFLETSVAIVVILKLPVFLLPGGLHQEILSQLQNRNAAPRLPQRSASAAAGKRLQREGEAFFFLWDVHVVASLSQCERDIWL